VQKKVLVAVNEHKATDRAVDYVGMMAAESITGLSVTLYHVMKPVPAFLKKEAQRNPEAHRRLSEMVRKYTTESDEIMGRARGRLIKLGMDPDNIEEKAMPRASDNVRDLLFEAEHGLYDAMVLGRRGLSKAQEMFVGSVTNKVVQHAERIPVWVVGGQVDSHKILCAVDGSEGALKAVDHLAFMVSGNPDVHITLVHVSASLARYCTLDFDQDMASELEEDLITGQDRCMDDFHAKAQRVLEDAGIHEDQIELESLGGTSVSGTLIDLVKKEGYGTVVLGRRGQNRSFFLGHVSDKIVAACRQAAVWVVG